jgi:hypothetical protein
MGKMMTDNNDNNTKEASSKIKTLSRASSFNKTASTAIDSPSKIQAIIFTNTDDLDNLNIISNNNPDGVVSPAILYENDFDLYSILKDMIKIPQQKSKQLNNVIAEPIVESYNKEQMDKDKRRVIFKSYKKLLTAQLNDISYTDGKDKWLLATNFNLMYSKNIKCIGTHLSGIFFFLFSNFFGKQDDDTFKIVI